MDVTAYPTVNGRYIEVEFTERSSTYTLLLTPDETEGLIKIASDALASMRKKAKS